VAIGAAWPAWRVILAASQREDAAVRALPERMSDAELTVRLLAQAQLAADPAATIAEIVARCVRLYGTAWSAGPVHPWVAVVLAQLGADPLYEETERLTQQARDLLDTGPRLT
jgi:hypothetical protein